MKEFIFLLLILLSSLGVVGFIKTTVIKYEDTTIDSEMGGTFTKFEGLGSSFVADYQKVSPSGQCLVTVIPFRPLTTKGITDYQFIFKVAQYAGESQKGVNGLYFKDTGTGMRLFYQHRPHTSDTWSTSPTVTLEMGKLYFWISSYSELGESSIFSTSQVVDSGGLQVLAQTKNTYFGESCANTYHDRVRVLLQTVVSYDSAGAIEVYQPYCRLVGGTKNSWDHPMLGSSESWYPMPDNEPSGYPWLTTEVDVDGLNISKLSEVGLVVDDVKSNVLDITDDTIDILVDTATLKLDTAAISTVADNIEDDSSYNSASIASLLDSDVERDPSMSTELVQSYIIGLTDGNDRVYFPPDTQTSEDLDGFWNSLVVQSWSLAPGVQSVVADFEEA